MFKSYYVLIADNGGAITTTITQANLCEKYFRGNLTLHAFYDEERAQAFLYDHLDTIMPRSCPLPSRFPIGIVITPTWFLSNGYWDPSNAESKDAPRCPIIFFNRRN